MNTYRQVYGNIRAERENEHWEREREMGDLEKGMMGPVEQTTYS